MPAGDAHASSTWERFDLLDAAHRRAGLGVLDVTPERRLHRHARRRRRLQVPPSASGGSSCRRPTASASRFRWLDAARQGRARGARGRPRPAASPTCGPTSCSSSLTARRPRAAGLVRYAVERGQRRASGDRAPFDVDLRRRRAPRLRCAASRASRPARARRRLHRPRLRRRRRARAFVADRRRGRRAPRQRADNGLLDARGRGRRAPSAPLAWSRR